MQTAAELNLRVLRVPEYSPHAVAEHTIALLLTLNRRIHKAYNRVRENNFSIDGLLGFDLHGRTVGVIGSGKIGTATAAIFAGFGCRVLLHDPRPSDAAAAYGKFVSLENLIAESDIVTLHCPLSGATHHLIDSDVLNQMKSGAILINTSRGGLIDTPATIAALKTGRLGGLAIDVYEEESGLFFEDRSSEIVHDDTLERLLTFPNVLVTSHQAFFTGEALTQIAATTIDNLDALASGLPRDKFEVRAEPQGVA